MKIIRSNLEDGRVPYDLLAQRLHLSHNSAGEVMQKASVLQSFHAALGIVEKEIGFAPLCLTYFASDTMEKDGPVVIDLYDATLLNIAVDGFVLNEGSYVVRKTQTRVVIEASLFTTEANVELTLRSGYAENWQDVPAELRSVIMDITRSLYENVGQENGLNTSCLAVLSSYRLPRLSLGIKT